MAHIRQSRPDFGRGFKVNILIAFEVVHSSLGRGSAQSGWQLSSHTRIFMYSSQFENNYFTEMCSGSETGSHLRLIDFVYHSTLGLRVTKKRRRYIYVISARGTKRRFVPQAK